MSPSITFLPATCELCGNWLPGHSSSCPRNGVHPSQWNFSTVNKLNDKDKPIVELDDDDSQYLYFTSSCGDDKMQLFDASLEEITGL